MQELTQRYASAWEGAGSRAGGDLLRYQVEMRARAVDPRVLAMRVDTRGSRYTRAQECAGKEWMGVEGECMVWYE